MIEKQNKMSLWKKLLSLMSLNSNDLRQDLALALQDKSKSKKNFSDNERLILQNVLKLGEKRVDDVMVPRADIEAVEEGETIASLIALFRDVAHSRLPVYEDNLDNMLGFIHIKDALLHLTDLKKTKEKNEVSIKFLTPVLKQKIGKNSMMRELLFVPPSMPVGDLLQKMQATHVHIAVVVDEYGGTDGLVTIEDLLEEVVGEIEDEHDDEIEMVKKIEGNVFVADARVELSELTEILGAGFNPSAYVQDADTLGGLIFDLIDRVPVEGEVITKFKGYEFEILQADPRRIKKVCIRTRKIPTLRAQPTTKKDIKK